MGKEPSEAKPVVWISRDLHYYKSYDINKPS